jgi:polyhydroxyalkanoate synthesis regulator protein
MELWADQQRVMRERARHFMDANNPVQVLSQIAEQNLNIWQQAMDSFKPESKNADKDSADNPESTPKTKPSDS